MSTENSVFIPVVEEFEELGTDLVLYAPVSGTPRKIVAFYQNALGSEPWPWNRGGWNNLTEALSDALQLKPGRLVIKHHRLPGGLAAEDMRIYLTILANLAQEDGFPHPPVVLVFPERYRQEVQQALAHGGCWNQSGSQSR